jgi:hypothetical protein
MTPQELASLSCGAATPPALVALEAEAIQWCATLGQLIELPGAFVAWFRVNPEHLPLVERGDFEAVRKLPREILTGGPVLVVADAAGAKQAPRFVRSLSRLRGVREIVAYRHGRFRRHRRPTCRGLQQ